VGRFVLGKGVGMGVEEYLADLPNRVWGETELDRKRHLQARVIFLNLMCKHLWETNIITSWCIHAGVYQSMLQMREATLPLKTKRHPPTPFNELEVAERRYRQAGADFVRALRSGGSLIVADLAQSYVTKELNLPWHWLTFELGIAWLAIVQGFATATHQKLYRHYVPTEPEAPDFKFHFESRPDETFAEMLDRFKDETLKHLKEQTELYKKLHPKGKQYSNQDVDRYVEYFFRWHIKHQSPGRIGQYEADNKTKRPVKYDRRAVKEQANLAREWLSVGFTQQNFEESLLIMASGKFDPGGVDSETNSPTTAPHPKLL
jgi:hypothetical protein